MFSHSPFRKFSSAARADSMASTPKPPNRRTTLYKPNCTHMRMVKVYAAGLECDLCRREPSFGFLYVCEQDVTTRPLSSSLSTPRKKLLKGNPKIAAELEQLHFTRSIVKAAAQGHYTPQQIERLKQQKKQFILARDSAMLEQEANASLLPPTVPALAERLAFESLQNGSKSRLQPVGKVLNPCFYKVCHACRPACRERTFLPFQQALDDNPGLPDVWDKRTMPLVLASTAASLGLPKPNAVPTAAHPPDDSFDSLDSSDSSDVSMSENDPAAGVRNVPNVASESEPRLRRSLDSDERFRTSLPDHQLASQDAQKTMPHQLRPLDFHYWNSRLEAQRQTASAVSLPQSSVHSLTPSRSRSLNGGKDEEEKVPGGVALTEEAVEHHEPDVITSI